MNKQEKWDYLKQQTLDSDPVMMKMMAKLLSESIERLLVQLHSWEDVYKVLDHVSYVASMADVVHDENKDLLESTVAMLYLRGYVRFRLSQPTMTDFELAKPVLDEHIRSGLAQSYERYQEIKDVRDPQVQQRGGT